MKKISSTILLVIGILIIVGTLNPIYLYYKENSIIKELTQLYTVSNKDLVNNRIELNNNRIEIIEDTKESGAFLQLVLNNVKLGDPIFAENATNNLTYAKGVWIAVFNIHENSQSTDANDKTAIVVMTAAQKNWTIYYLDQDQRYEVRHISIDQKSQDYLDTLLIKLSSNPMMGYESDIGYASGSVSALMIPMILCIIGLAMALIGLVMLCRFWIRKKK
ncbi:hypothetical protein ACFOQM_06450 [Paenibacillus sp. GCM10012307]|uniref:Uncharacterized protein n=1 Tax=Paenibacillus roseus TaxID=2798579 RepID=A0A934MKE0_9BACL|nr:hypothetical protein [Paenibacillus roseus]MBJ6360940.1 hypothetical protein [Paenibacillus roseus]